MADKMYTQHEILEMVRQKANVLDSFRLRVSSRAAPHLAPEIRATFDEVSIAHITSPEVWIPELFGGGQFELLMNHSQDLTSSIGGPYKITYDPATFPPQKMDYATMVATMSKADWQGPTKLVYPRPPNAPPGPTQTKIQPGTGIIEQVMNGTPTSTNSVGGKAVHELIDVAAATKSPIEKQEASRLMQVSFNLEEKERSLKEKELEMKFNELKTGLLAQQRPVAEVVPKTNLLETVTVLAPFIMKFIEMKENSDRQFALMQQQANDRQIETLKLMMDKKPAIDPEVKALIEKFSEKKDDFGQMKMMMDMIGTMSQVSMQVIQSNAEALAAAQPQGESPAYKLARQALVSLGAIFGNAQTAMLPDDEEGPQEEQQALTAGDPEGVPESQQMQPEPAVAEQIPSEPVKKKYSQMQLLERAIKRMDPKEKVAERFKKALVSPKFKKMMRVKYNGDFMALIQHRLGAWAMEKTEHLEYLNTTGIYMYEEAVKAGLLFKKSKVEPTPEDVPEKVSETASMPVENGVDNSEKAPKIHRVKTPQAAVPA